MCFKCSKECRTEHEVVDVLLLPTRATGDVTFGNERTAKESEGATDGSGEGFNTLAGYLFGNNTQERAMDMTTPVNIDVSPTRGRYSCDWQACW